MGRHDLDSAMTVTQLLQQRPAAAAVLVRRGMACVGCPMASFETLVEVASVYGQEPTVLLAELAGTPEAEPELG